MRLKTMLIACLLMASTGCQAIQLRDKTLDQAHTWTDIQYRQVLDNLAMLSCRPSALPYFSVAGTATTSINQTVGVNYALGADLITSAGRFLGRYLFDHQTVTPTASQVAAEQWNSAATTNPDELQLMRSLYQRALGISISQKYEDNLNSFFGKKPERLAAALPGWYHVASRQRVPACACYVGHYCDTYVWVDTADVDHLTRFTLAILDIATTASTSPKNQPDPKVIADQIKALSDILKDNSLNLTKDEKDKIISCITNLVKSIPAGSNTIARTSTAAEADNEFQPDHERKNFFNPLAVPPLGQP